MDVEDDIGADVAAAIKGLKDDEGAAGAAGLDGALAPEAALSSAAQTEANDRDPQGRFVAKAEAAPQAQDGAQAAAPAAAEPISPEGTPAPAGQPPSGLSPAVKAMWATLPAEVRADFDKRERESYSALEQRAAQLKRYEPLEAAIAPHRQRLALAGVDDAQYVRKLIAADEMLRGPNRIEAIAHIARGYGIDLRQLAQPGPDQPQQAQMPPEYVQLAQTVQTLQQQLSQQTSAAQQAEEAKVQSDIQAFSKDHIYFENVKADMAGLLRAGAAKDLNDAYDKACWARDDIRPLLRKDEDQKRQAQAAEAARAKASQAKAAAGSITGSPLPGSAPDAAANSNATIEDDVRAAVAAVRSSVR